MPDFSIIIPTYNRRQYLVECLESVAAQRYRPYEVIVVDDGSTDGTLEVLKEAPGLKLIQQENAGPSNARNRGAAAATGDYLAFLDSDDLWFPWSLDSIATLVERHGRPSLIFARFEDFSGSPPTADEMSPQGEIFEDFLASAHRGFFAGAGMMVIERNVFAASGGFVEDGLNAEDHDLALRLGTACGFLQVTRPVVVAHRIHGGNKMDDVGNSLAGIARLVSSETKGCYPGGSARNVARRSIIARHARAAILAGIRGADRAAALELYRQTLGWNLRAGRVAFLLAVPVFALQAVVSGRSAVPALR